MTDEKINAAIAAHLGITRKTGIPDFSGDLNEMHDAEKVLSSTQQDEYWDRLTDEGVDHLFATARQRAEAFLLTLGKWSATDKESLTVGATTKESSEVQSTSSGGSGGASTYGGRGLGIAGATWPPETRITVNGKTFCLADIDKEMTE